ncbi:MAG: autotransporter outer membrane beta-barrel domain-containing protein, partial [Proteobacteria bacterium]|nr:autotransporter outer membrane beta-barrel domain-containing protein [Pseudomonadota bacterium]
AATGNSVTISGGTMNYVYGGNSYIGDATGNSVTISGGTVNGNVYGGNSWSGNATGNSVTISGGEVGQNVYGGYSDSDAATGNSVTISGGEIGQDGEVGQDGYGVYGGASLIGDTTYNTVTISGSPTFGPTTNLWGGKSDGDDSFTGNTLNVWNYRGSSVPGVQHFQYYNFILPASLKGLEVTGTVDFSGPGGATSTVTGVSIMGGGRAPQVGKSISLIHADAGLQGGTITNNGAILAGKKGATLNLSFRLDQQANDLYAVVERVRAAPETKVLSEGFLSGVALVNQGADLAAGQGMAEAVRASMESKYGLGVFAAFSGGWSRYDTGSHTDLSSISLLAGVSKGIDLTPGRLTLGLFFEYGNGSYDTSNSFSGINADGDGDIDHIGGGIIGRMDFANAGPGHVYTEASLRAGSVSNEYRNAHLRDSLGRHASYDADSAYYGLHLGVGYIWNVNDKAALDLYGKYFWTRVQGDDVILSTGDPVGFDGVDSHRLRIGTRFSYAADTRFTPYAGVAYEHEFDGKAAATTYGYAIDEPDLQGGTGVGEIGLKLKPAQDLSLDLGVQGYVGTREGVSGSLRIKYEF